MRVDDWLVDYLIKKGCTDVFGIPGVVIMDFLYAIDRRKEEISPHLCFHEQGASFGACGYAQTDGKLGVAYATRGPGFTNMITAIADAYSDSIPVLFITAHSSKMQNDKMRVLVNQEIDSVHVVEKITKSAFRVDELSDFQRAVILACDNALSGRPGPVFVDINSSLFSQQIDENTVIEEKEDLGSDIESERYKEAIESEITKAKRPIILIGNSVRDEKCIEQIKAISQENNIPILSSRSGQDIVSNHKLYYGYIGSRGTRHSNFILSKADLIISLGNRLAFPTESQSFNKITEKACIIRADIDENEFERRIPNSKCYVLSYENAINVLRKSNLHYTESDKWVEVCNTLRLKLDKWDNSANIEAIATLMGKAGSNCTFTVDVGNHSFWVTIAYAYSQVTNRIMYSGSFGTLGSALPKAIGAYYSTKHPVMCFTGDQGFQFNIQELQYISYNRIPITVVILNNHSSGMIKDREFEKYGRHLLHTTDNDGYSQPDFEKVANAYNIAYFRITEKNADILCNIRSFENPLIVEFEIGEAEPLYPYLPLGRVCQDMEPLISRELYYELDSL